MAGPFTLTWTGTAIDEEVFSFEVSQSEGEAASLKIEIRNPRYPLLSGELWATLYYGEVSLFFGRLIGIPDDIENEVVSLTFTAKPDDFDEQKAALAETLKVLPYWDPIFVTADQRDNPDTVLDGYTADWHIDRVTNEVSISDITEGEDGTAVITDHTYDSLKLSYGEAPADTVECTATISYRQQATGTVDLMASVYDAFEAADSADAGFITSYTGGGLVQSWPKSDASIGAGWTVGTPSTLARADGYFAPAYDFVIAVATGGVRNPLPNTGINITVSNPEGSSLFDDGSSSDTAGITSTVALNPLGYYGQSPDDTGGPMNVGFPLWYMQGTFNVDYLADRQRIETVTFTMVADMQPIISDGVEPIKIELSTQDVDQPVDPGGLPIEDVRRTSYMLTDRGHQSLEYLIVLCRAHLVARARAVTVSCEIGFDDAILLTLRQSRTIVDDRIPGGQATGKVSSYSFSVSGDAATAKGSFSIACTIGRGATLEVPEGELDYVEDDYVEDGYQATTVPVSVLPDVYFESYDQTVIDDDGIDLFNMTPEGSILSLAVIDGAAAQEDALRFPVPDFEFDGTSWVPAAPNPGGLYRDTSDAIQGLNTTFTRVALALKPLTRDEPFQTAFPIVLSPLVVPKTLDLEA